MFMKTICYIFRTAGTHGFLKLVGDEPLKRGTHTRILGPEIHFRTNRSLMNEFVKSSGLEARHYDPDGQPMEVSTYDEKPRRKETILLYPVINGEAEQMFTLWAQLLQNARDIEKRGIVMDRFVTNCHTLTFEALERAGLTPPYDVYRQRLADERAEIKARWAAHNAAMTELHSDPRLP